MMEKFYAPTEFVTALQCCQQPRHVYRDDVGFVSAESVKELFLRYQLESCCK
jgi:hypothetical protein